MPLVPRLVEDEEFRADGLGLYSLYFVLLGALGQDSGSKLQVMGLKVKGPFSHLINLDQNHAKYCGAHKRCAHNRHCCLGDLRIVTQVWSSKFRVQGMGFRDQGSRFRVYKVQGAGCGMQGAGYGFQGIEVEPSAQGQSLGFRV